MELGQCANRCRTSPRGERSLRRPGSLVHGIVTGHGGRIEVSSRVGQGTRFAIYLRRTEDAEFPSAAARSDIVPPGAQQRAS